MSIECRTTLAEALVCQVLQHHGADFQQPPLPPYDLRVVFAISAPLPTTAHDALQHIARNTYGMRMLAQRGEAGGGGVGGARVD